MIKYLNTDLILDKVKFLFHITGRNLEQRRYRWPDKVISRSIGVLWWLHEIRCCTAFNLVMFAPPCADVKLQMLLVVSVVACSKDCEAVLMWWSTLLVRPWLVDTCYSYQRHLMAKLLLLCCQPHDSRRPKSDDDGGWLRPCQHNALVS